MAFGWRASGNTNAELVDNLNSGNSVVLYIVEDDMPNTLIAEGAPIDSVALVIRALDLSQSRVPLLNEGQGLFKSERIKEAMLAVDRGDFAPANPYMDAPISIGYSATISAPHMHATALHYLEDVIKNDSRILDVGSGSGYLVACFAKMIGPKGKVVGIEHIPQLVQLSINNLKKNHASLLENGVVKIIEGDGRLGYEKDAPYDAIHVGAAAPEIPSKLLDQLAVGGRMVIPVGRDNQEFLQIDKISEDNLVKKRLMGVIYVPLTSKEEQIGHRRIQYV